jgi:hypothetical protein
MVTDFVDRESAFRKAFAFTEESKRFSLSFETDEWSKDLACLARMMF